MRYEGRTLGPSLIHLNERKGLTVIEASAAEGLLHAQHERIGHGLQRRRVISHREVAKDGAGNLYVDLVAEERVETDHDHPVWMDDYSALSRYCYFLLDQAGLPTPDRVAYFWEDQGGWLKWGAEPPETVGQDTCSVITPSIAFKLEQEYPEFWECLYADRFLDLEQEVQAAAYRIVSECAIIPAARERQVNSVIAAASARADLVGQWKLDLRFGRSVQNQRQAAGGDELRRANRARTIEATRRNEDVVNKARQVCPRETNLSQAARRVKRELGLSESRDIQTVARILKHTRVRWQEGAVDG